MPADVSTGVETPEEQHLREAARVFVLRHQHGPPTAVSITNRIEIYARPTSHLHQLCLRNMVAGGVINEHSFPAQTEVDSSIEFITVARSPPLSREADFKVSTLRLHAPNSYLEDRTKG